jgi:hypothetical protein
VESRGQAGGITEHLEDIEKRVALSLKWALYNQLKLDIYSGIHVVPESTLFPKGRPDQMPGVYFLYKSCKNSGHLWWPGGVADQPFFLMQEFDACANGEAEFQNKIMPYLMKLHEAGKQQSGA